MHTFADILPIAGRSFPLLLTYKVPAEMADRLQVGSPVLVPLGKRTVPGYVVALHDAPPQVKVLRPIHTVLDSPPVFTEREVALARWISAYYCCPLPVALRPFLSELGALRVRRRLRLTAEGVRYQGSGVREGGESSAAVLSAIAKGRCTRKSIAAAVGWSRANTLLRSLKEKGLVEETAYVLPPAGRRVEELVSLAVDEVSALEEARKLSRRARKQAALLDYLVSLKADDTGAPQELPLSVLTAAGHSPAAIRALSSRGLVRCRQIPRWRIPWPDAPTDHPPSPQLNQQQREAEEKVLLAVRERRPEIFLLFGITGSGKTEIFLRATVQALEMGKQALILVPEISLTAQVVGLLRSRFGSNVAVLHSALSVGERRDEKERIRLGEARVIVGPRSALFAPFTDLGIIVVDEEHDPSYKQEQEPRYHARDAALKLAEQFGCPCVLAGATPSLESFFLAQKGVYTLLRLEERPEGRALPQVHLLDLREKTTSDPKDPAPKKSRPSATVGVAPPGEKGATPSLPRSRKPKMLLPPLQQALADCLEGEGQAILFLNRRGHSTFLFCPLCGHSFRCPHCQVALIYHAQGHALRCHHCEYAGPAPTLCPNCQGATLRFSGFGTQRVAEEALRLFPAARVSRMDRDTTSTKGAHLRLITDFRSAATDLLVGTQMVSKGLHFPGVTVVGVIAADISLNKPDFRAAERTFQLLTQVAGRAGRGDEPGEVFIQTYHPDHYAIQAASAHDYEAFYAEELKLREEADYPPFCHLANITVSGPEKEKVQEHCRHLAERVGEEIGEKEVEILGPAPAPLEKLKDRYRHHFLLRAKESGLIQRIIAGMSEDLASRGKIQVTVDIDPVALM